MKIERALTVWVCIKDHGAYEGMAEPVRVFANKTLADIYVSGAIDSYGTSIKTFEREIETGEQGITT